MGLISNLAGTVTRREDLVLRVGIGATLIWAAYRSILNPTDWIGFVPDWVITFLPKEVFLTAHGFFELGVGALLIAGVWPRFISTLAFLDLSSILIFYGVDDITFRDVGLTLAAVVLLARQFRR